VIVGGGLAGMVAARKLQQRGVAVTVLEKSDIEGGFGNAVISGGLLHVAWEPPDSTEEAKHARLLAETEGEIDPDLAAALAAQSSHIIPWLQAEGIEMRSKSEEPATRWTLYPFRAGMGRRLLPDLGPARAMLRLYDNFRREGGDIRLGATAASLVQGPAGWRVSYRHSTSPSTIDASSVVFADGGFQANPELLSRYVGPNAGLCLLRATTTGTGDGLRMLLDNGAGATGLGRVYGHLVSLDALHSDDLWPFPHFDEMCMTGLVVTRRGDRLPLTTTSPVGLVTSMARSDDPRGFTVVFDHDLWTGPATGAKLGLPALNPELARRGGHLVSSETLEGLAGLLGIQTQRLANAFEQHNATPGVRSLKRAPYYAARVIAGITFTMGGAMIGPDAAVLTPDRAPIPGLFAAGSTTGGLQGGPNGGYVGGLAPAATFGYIAAESIADLVRTSAAR
jgi:fumarate reductase flavoprotein subunit